MENSFIIDENKKCFLNGQELTNVTNVDIKNINALDITEVVITVAVKSIDVKYKGLVKWILLQNLPNPAIRFWNGSPYK